MKRKSRTGCVSPRRRRSRCGAVQRSIRAACASASAVHSSAASTAAASEDGRHPPRVGGGQSLDGAGEPVQPQGELDLQRALGRGPVLAQQPAHPLQALGDRVDVHPQHLGRPGRGAAGAEVAPAACATRSVPPLRVVVEDRRRAWRRRSRARPGPRRPAGRRSPARPRCAALPLRPSATRVAAHRAASACAGAIAAGPVRRPAAADGHRPGAGLRSARGARSPPPRPGSTSGQARRRRSRRAARPGRRAWPPGAWPRRAPGPRHALLDPGHQPRRAGGRGRRPAGGPAPAARRGRGAAGSAAPRAARRAPGSRPRRRCAG